VVDYTISFGEDEEYAKAYMESKGWTSVVKLQIEGSTYHLNFYDPVRLAQCISDELDNGDVCFFEENLIIIERLTEDNIHKAIETIIAQKRISKLIPKN